MTRAEPVCSVCLCGDVPAGRGTDGKLPLPLYSCVRVFRGVWALLTSGLSECTHCVSDPNFQVGSLEPFPARPTPSSLKKELLINVGGTDTRSRVLPTPVLPSFPESALEFLV